MRKNSLGLAAAALAMAAAAGMGSVEPASSVTNASQTNQSQVQKGATNSTKATKRSTAQISYGGGFGSRGNERRRGPGWTQAHVQRMARKKRNQARHKKACRG